MSFSSLIGSSSIIVLKFGCSSILFCKCPIAVGAVDQSICSGQVLIQLFKSDRGALSAKESRETLLTTRSSSEKFYSLVLS